MRWFPGYNKRRKLTIPANRAVGDVSNFPVMINISDSSGIDNTDLSDFFLNVYDHSFVDTCDGVFSTNWADKSSGTSSAYFSAGTLQLYAASGHGSYGANALLQQEFKSAGMASISFDWWPVAGVYWWDDDFTDAELDVKIVNKNPQYNTNSWNYGRCEQWIGHNKFLSLSLRSSKTNKITIRQNLNGSVSSLITVSFVHGALHNVIWEVDFIGYTTSVIIDGVTLIYKKAWNPSILDAFSEVYKYNFHWHNYKYGGPTQKFDNISVYGSRSASIDKSKEIVVTDVNNNPLKSEIAYYNSLDLRGILWTSVPTITSGIDNHLYLYYDKLPGYEVPIYTEITGSGVATEVWDSDFVAVYHFNQRPTGGTGCIIDSTSYNNHGTPHGGMTDTDWLNGQIDKALDFDGSNDYIEVPYDVSLAPTSQITFSILDYKSNWTDGRNDRLLSKTQYGGYNFQITAQHIDPVVDANGTYVTASYPRTDVPAGYNLFTCTFDGRYFNNYLNDTIKNSNDSGSYKSINYAYNNAMLIGAEVNAYSSPDGYYHKGYIDEIQISKVARSEAWVNLTHKTMFDDLISYSDIEYLPGYEPSYRNIWVSDDYIFRCTVSGVMVYDSSATELGHIFVLERASSVWSDDSYLYIGTTASGVLKHSLTSISGGVFTDLSIYKQYPDITSNGVNYIHGAGDYFCTATVSGVDHINRSTNSHIKTVVSGALLHNNVSKCYQTSLGPFYYITNTKMFALDYKAKYYQVVHFSEAIVQEDQQIAIQLDVSNFNFEHVQYGGADIRFFDEGFNKIPFFIDYWSLLYSIIWVRPPMGSSFIYMVYGNEDVIGTESDPDAVFLLYDEFTESTLDSSKWTVVGNPSDFYISNGELVSKSIDGSYILSSGTLGFPIVVEQGVYKEYGTDDKISYVNTLVPNEDGMYWYTGTNIARKAVFNNTAVNKPITKKFNNNINYKLITTIAQNRIMMQVFLTDDTVYLSDSWSGLTNGATDRQLKLFGGESTNTSFRLRLSYIRVKRYDPKNIVVSHIDKAQLLYYSTLNAVYDNTIDWTEDTVGHMYKGNSNFFPHYVQMNDLFVTEGTTTSGNTIFLATNDNATVIEEKRGNEDASQKRFYRIR